MWYSVDDAMVAVTVPSSSPIEVSFVRKERLAVVEPFFSLTVDV